jgi:uncharacterized protein (DUF433 family)
MGLIMATVPVRVVYAHIVKDPDYCGGKAAIGNTGVRVNNVVFAMMSFPGPPAQSA